MFRYIRYIACRSGRLHIWFWTLFTNPPQFQSEMNTLVKNGELLILIEESIREGKSVSLTVKGNSMSPLLKDGKDVVKLVPFRPEDIKIGDVILFRYGTRFLLHRIISMDASNYEDPVIITKGDALKNTENTRMSAVVALAVLPSRHWFSFINDIFFYAKKRLSTIRNRLK